MFDRTPIRVFLLDDHEIVRRGIKDVLEHTSDITVVGEASTPEEAVRRVPACRPDVAVLDIRLAGGASSGIEVCRQIRATQPHTRCLMLTSFADDTALVESMAAGAAGFVLKNVRAAALTDGIRRVFAGELLFDRGGVARAIEHRRTIDDRSIEFGDLSPRELRILELLTESLTNREIADRLFLAEKTVKNYVSILLGKLGMERRTEAAVYAATMMERRGSGLTACDRESV